MKPRWTKSIAGPERSSHKKHKTEFECNSQTSVMCLCALLWPLLILIFILWRERYGSDRLPYLFAWQGTIAF